MHVRYPIGLRRLATPGADSIALLFAIESFTRALLASVIPLQAYALVDDAQSYSALFFVVSVIGLVGGLMVPRLVRLTARRWVYTAGAVLLVGASALLAEGTLNAQAAGMACRVLGVVAMTICINLYIMDVIARQDVTRAEPKRLFYSAGAWTAGPALGVYLGTAVADWVPYAVSGGCGLVTLGYFWLLRMKENPTFSRPAKRIPSPRANIRRFFAQPRLVLAWTISTGRNSWWVMFFNFAPIYALELGYSEMASGLIVSVGSSFLFLMPLWGWCMRRFGVRRILLTGFGFAAVVTVGAALAAGLPAVAVACLLLGAFGMVLLDVVGNIPFLLAVRSHERPEMTSVYATYRDAADLAPPGVFTLLLKFFELPAVFVAGGVAMLGVAALSRRMHPRFAMYRPARQASPSAA